MVPRKLSLAIARYPYGGNGGTSSEVPDIGDWLVENILWAKSDPRIDEVFHERFSDTPICATRNASVVWAKEVGADLLLMLDSDMKPDLNLGIDPAAKPFLKSSFEFIYDHYGKGPSVVAAPYGGPPPHENSYLFRWRAFQSDNPDPTGFKLDQYTREEAATESGIKEVSALPTGVILWDLRAFDLVDARGRGWFYYEWADEFCSKKASTEDVTATRDISMAGIMRNGYNPIFCNWDAWAGHWKPKCVGKPTILTAGVLSQNVLSAVQRDWCGEGALLNLRRPEGLPPATNAPKSQSERGPEFVGDDVDILANLRPDDQEIMDILAGIPKDAFVVEVGPGSRPIERANELVDIEPSVDGHVLDVSSCRLPYGDGEVDFLYCRHTLEDLKNPGFFLAEVARVAKAGFIETPSPLCECTRGVDWGTNSAWRGFHHHHSIAWSEAGVLHVLPKLPIIETMVLPEVAEGAALLAEGREFWHTRHHWSGPLKYEIHKLPHNGGAIAFYESLARDAVASVSAACV